MNRSKGDIETFLILARRGETDHSKLRGIIDRAPVTEVTSWTDQEGLDLMQNVIIANNAVAAEYLLCHGFFVRPHVPEKNPYCHLASLLGERGLLQVLLQHRPDDFFPSNVPISLPSQVVESIHSSGVSKRDEVIQLASISTTDEVDSSTSRPSSASRKSKSKSKSSATNAKISTSQCPQYRIESLSTFLSVVENSSSQKLSPLDVASRTGNLECVKVILNACVLKRHAEDDVDSHAQNSSDVSLACVADSPLALALILHQKPPGKEDWEAAVEICLRHTRPECLDLLLRMPMDTRHMFKSMNFFHVMFNSASMKGPKSYPRMAQTTEVLVRHGHNVNARVPCRTYPMYALLSNAFCYTDYDSTKYYMQGLPSFFSAQTLRTLIKHEANPNFDEVEFEKKFPRQAANKVVGRAAFSSALHCLFETVESHMEHLTTPDLAVQFIEDCASVLMSCPDANMNVIGFVGDPKQGVKGSILHQLAKSSVVIGANAEVFRCVLRHGADPNLKVKDKYAINVYFDELFAQMRSPTRDRHDLSISQDNAKAIMRLCCFMTPAAIRDCLQLFVKDHGKNRSPQVQSYLELVKEELTRRGQEVQTLLRASAWCVWKACGYRGEHVHTLKVSPELKTFILPMNF